MSGSAEQLKNLLDEWVWKLLAIARRAFILEAFTAELRTVSRGKNFEIFNDVVWQTVLDTHAMFVIEFASWSKGVYTKSGLLRTLQSSHCKQFPRKRRRSDKQESEHLKQHYDKHHQESYARLFPDAEAWPSHRDFDELVNRFEKAMQPVVDDRHVNQAHRHEPGKKGTAKALDIGELRGLLQYSEQFLNDLMLVSGSATYIFTDMNFANVEHTATEVVDIVLFGWSQYRDYLRRTGEDRYALYGRMHEKHDAFGNTHLLFNGPEIREALSEENPAHD